MNPRNFRRLILIVLFFLIPSFVRPEQPGFPGKIFEQSPSDPAAVHLAAAAPSIGTLFVEDFEDMEDMEYEENGGGGIDAGSEFDIMSLFPGI